MTTQHLYSMIKGITEIRVISLLTVLWFGLFFHLEWLHFEGGLTLDLSEVLYSTAGLMGLALMALPNLGRLPVKYFAGLVLAVYILMSAILGAWDRALPLLGLEFVLLLITMLVIRYLSQSLLNFEIAYQYFVLDVENSRILPFQEASDRVARELERLQHYNRPMSVIYCAAYNPAASENSFRIRTSALDVGMTDAFQARYQQIQLGRSIASLTYKSDTIVEYGNGIVVFLPETNEEDAEKFMHQLYTFVKVNLQVNLLMGTAFFPQDGATFESLLQNALANVHIYFPSEPVNPEKIRMGDVMVDLEQRILIEKQSEWLNKLAYQSPSSRAIYYPIKRAMDIAAFLAVAPLLLPLMALITLLIYLDDGAPIFYMQPRTGYGGHRFKMYKFRTMKVNAPSIPPKVITLPNGEVRYEWPEKIENDPRITRVGRFLRKTSLDEIPQLLNVLFGHMSIVGPRPTSWNIDMYTLHQTEHLTVQPGITGLWQVSARDAQNFDERLLWDVKYVEKMSLLLDLIIIWRTVAQVVNKGGV